MGCLMLIADNVLPNRVALSGGGWVGLIAGSVPNCVAVSGGGCLMLIAGSVPNCESLCLGEDV